MPAVIVLDGCEKAGKTTLTSVIRRQCAVLNISCEAWKGHSNQPFAQSTFEWLGQVRCDLVVLDRAWPSKWVYGDKMGFDQKFDALGTSAEKDIRTWIEDRGVCRILVQPVEILVERRTADDLGDPEQEHRLWLEYAEEYGWEVLELRNGMNNVKWAALRLIGEAMDRAADVRRHIFL